MGGKLREYTVARLGSDIKHEAILFRVVYIISPWKRKWQHTAVFLTGESQGRGSLVGCCLWGRTESDTTEVT